LGRRETIEKKEFKKEKIQELCFYIHNLFSDTVLNTINAHTDQDKQEYRDGLDFFYLLMSNYNRSKERGFFKRRADKAHTLFINSNQLLCQTNPEIENKMRKYNARFFPGFPRYKKKLLSIFTGDESLTEALLKRELSEESAEYLAGRLQDMSLWNQMSKDYTEIIYPFLRNRYNWTGNSFIPQTRKKDKSKKNSQKKQSQGMGNSGKKQEKEMKKNKKSQKGGGQSEDKKQTEKNRTRNGEKPSNPSEDMLEDMMKNLIIRKGHKPFSSTYVKYAKRLDRLYNQRAGRLAIFAHDSNKESPHYEKNLGKEELPLDQMITRGVDWGATKIINRKDGKKDIHIYSGDFPIVLPFEHEENPGGIPDLSFIFDTSSSEKFDPFKGYGEYHYACLAFYSILNYLEENGLAPLINYNIINFSDITIPSGWKTYSEIFEIKRILFDYQSGATILNPSALEEMRITRKDNFISFMLTDGGFNLRNNTLDVIKEIENIVNSGAAGFYLFLLNSDVGFAREHENSRNFINAMNDLKVPVHPISSSKDFLYKTIEFGKNLYGRLVENE
jgi:hypothetical protein